MKRRGFEAGPIDRAIETLCEQGYLDDARFACVFAEDKRELEQWGSERIRKQLTARGVERELIDEALSRDARGDELNRALAVLRRRFPSASGARGERERAFAVLLRKGYDSELALDALRVHVAGGQDA